MKRRAHWMAVVGSATLGLAGLSGCQTMNSPTGPMLGSSGTETITRAAEPDDPQGIPALQLYPSQPRGLRRRAIQRRIPLHR